MNENTTSDAGAAMNCEQVSLNELAERYLLGQLSQADQEAYELHYFECARCFEELKAHQVLQTGLKRSASAIRASELPRRIAWRMVWAPIAVMIILLVGFGVWQGWRWYDTRTGPATAAQKVEQSPSNIPSLILLAAVEPAPYTRVTLRGNEDEATREFQVAMRHYLKKDYAGAITGLRASLRRDPDAIDARFYLGVSYLLTNQTDSAVEELLRTTSAGDSPYLEGAHFYLAKAFLHKNNPARAKDELRKAVALRGRYEAEAQKLIEALQSVRNEQQ